MHPPRPPTAEALTLPPEGPPDMADLLEAAARHGIDILGTPRLQ